MHSPCPASRDVSLPDSNVGYRASVPHRVSSVVHPLPFERGVQEVFLLVLLRKAQRGERARPLNKPLARRLRVSIEC